MSKHTCVKFIKNVLKTVFYKRVEITIMKSRNKISTDKKRLDAKTAPLPKPLPETEDCPIRERVLSDNIKELLKILKTANVNHRVVSHYFYI